ncbi:MAG: hypothetical protein ACKO1N_02725, partial [Erythrobacter sp.]
MEAWLQQSNASNACGLKIATHLLRLPIRKSHCVGQTLIALGRFVGAKKHHFAFTISHERLNVRGCVGGHPTLPSSEIA